MLMNRNGCNPTAAVIISVSCTAIVIWNAYYRIYIVNSKWFWNCVIAVIYFFVLVSGKIRVRNIKCIIAVLGKGNCRSVFSSDICPAFNWRNKWIIRLTVLGHLKDYIGCFKVKFVDWNSHFSCCFEITTVLNRVVVIWNVDNGSRNIHLIKNLKHGSRFMRISCVIYIG